MTEEEPLPVEEESKISAEQGAEKAETEQQTGVGEGVEGGETSLKLILVLPGVSNPQEVVVSVYE